MIRKDANHDGDDVRLDPAKVEAAARDLERLAAFLLERRNGGWPAFHPFGSLVPVSVFTRMLLIVRNTNGTEPRLDADIVLEARSRGYAADLKRDWRRLLAIQQCVSDENGADQTG